MQILLNLFSYKNEWSKCIRRRISSNKNITVQRGPPGIGFKYLDGSGNFDIGKKRLVNVAKPEKTFDAVNKDYFDNRYGFLHDIYDSFQITFNNYLTKLDDLKESSTNLL